MGLPLNSSIMRKITGTCRYFKLANKSAQSTGCQIQAYKSKLGNEASFLSFPQWRWFLLRGKSLGWKSKAQHWHLSAQKSFGKVIAQIECFGAFMVSSHIKELDFLLQVIMLTRVLKSFLFICLECWKALNPLCPHG